MKIEFKIGDIVTYFPYESEFPAVVTKVSNYNVFGIEDDRVWYALGSVPGSDVHYPVNAMTTGLCIKESKYFKENRNEVHDISDMGS